MRINLLPRHLSISARHIIGSSFTDGLFVISSSVSWFKPCHYIYFMAAYNGIIAHL